MKKVRKKGHATKMVYKKLYANGEIYIGPRKEQKGKS